MPRSATSHLGLFCLPVSHKWDARLKRVKDNVITKVEQVLEFSILGIIFTSFEMLIDAS